MIDPVVTDLPLSLVNVTPACVGLVPLKNGRLMLAWGDPYAGVLKAIDSGDDGRTWSSPRELKLADGTTFASRGVPCLLRLASGRLGLVHRQSDQATHRYPMHVRQTYHYHVSDDEGQTWSPGVVVNTQGGREFAMMDALIQLSTGRLVMPMALVCGPAVTRPDPSNTPRFGERFGNVWAYCTMFCRCYYSDDEGRTWRPSANEVHATIEGGVGGGYSMDEPFVAELADGRLLMMANTTLGRLFRSYSEDGGETWHEAEATDLVQRRSPLLVRRVPGSDDVLVLWNQLSPWEGMNALFRHRLSSAISSDGGKTWKHFQNLESLDDTAKLTPDSDRVEFTFIGPGARQPLDRARYHRAPGPLRMDHPSCRFHEGKAYICYGVGQLGDAEIIEQTYCINYDEVGEKLGFSKTPIHGKPGSIRSKWWLGFNRFRVLPVEWFYRGV